MITVLDKTDEYVLVKMTQEDSLILNYKELFGKDSIFENIEKHISFALTAIERLKNSVQLAQLVTKSEEDTNVGI